MPSFPLKLSVIVLTFQVFPAGALTIIDDTALPSYTTTGIATSADDIEIVTTPTSTSPQINMAGGVGLGASGGHTLTVNSTNKFVIQSNATGGYNAFIGARALGGNLHSQSELELNFIDGRGIYVPNSGVATFDKKVTINTTGQSIGVMAYSTSATGGKVHFKDELIINASGDNTYGLVTQQGNPNGDSPELIFDKKVTIKMTGNNSTGISTQDISPTEVLTDSLIHFKDGLDLEINNGTAISASLTRSKVQVDGDSRIIANGSNAIEAIEGQVAINGKSTIIGNIEAVNTGNVSLNLSNGSSITGVMDNYTVTPPPSGYTPGKIDLSLQGSDSNWNLTNNSYIDSLSLNGSAVTFNGTQNTSLTTESLSGNGTFGMQANVVDGTSDKLIITGISSGNHLVKVKNDGSQATTGTETLALVQTTDAGANFKMADKADLGGYRYDIRQNGNNWELYSTGDLSATADTTLSFINTSYLLNYAETQTLLQRMGELRQSENSDGDVWVRAFTGKFDSFGGGKLSNFDMDYTGMQAGVDKRLSVNDADVYLGVMGGTSKADTNYKEGDGDVTGYHFGLYGTYVAANDFYVDTILKYSNFKNSFNVTSVDYGRINSDVDSDGYGLSVEVGKRFYFDPSKSGYYIEPQAQISYAHQGSASTTASDGLNINMDSYDSTLGRVSALIGYEVKNSQTPMNVYFKTGYVTEMSGNTSYSLNGNKESYDFGGDWWENSIGITAQIKKAHNLYLEGTYSSGNKFDQTQLNAGYRYSF